MTEFSNLLLFLSLWVLVGISVRYYKTIMASLFFKPTKETLFIKALVLFFVLLALIGVPIFFMWLGYGLDWMFYHPDLFSYFKWHYVYFLLYFTFMHIQHGMSNLIVKSYNKGVKRVISDALEDGNSFYPQSITHKKLKEYFLENYAKSSINNERKPISYFSSVMEEHILNEENVYTSVKDLDDDKFVRKNLDGKDKG